MAAPTAEPITIALPGGASVSGLVDCPADPHAAFVLAHGAGAGMAHAFLASLAQGLARCGIATLRFNFPYLELGGKRPDPPAIAQAAVRAAVAHATTLWPDLPLFAGGKSFGGRMTSQAQADAPLQGARGLAFVGFPLHPAGRPGVERGAHLDRVRCPMLFLQGTRDELADPGLVAALVDRLGARATLTMIDDADHAFHVRRQSGSSDAEVVERIADTMHDWMTRCAAGPSS